MEIHGLASKVGDQFPDIRDDGNDINRFERLVVDFSLELLQQRHQKGARVHLQTFGKLGFNIG